MFYVQTNCFDLILNIIIVIFFIIIIIIIIIIIVCILTKIKHRYMSQISHVITQKSKHILMQ